ncbi:hypothetical protein S100390_v1c08750 [Spiroplasma sp. NBRC 100390]|uniref:Eco57I restriction-modification methylase domain-containing protein n=1 Tax=unclassified Spiroplasma TaxID=2637901 RepID=UPI000892976D|nr:MULTISPECIES: N-6 DNA methylase [unclassified Spiroplasma]AOX44211.1 hypothetical protein STU14_v1c08750 [Spiroplasma sp. TU-14]APE13681.1 hypothetical protein S100390_v1c08750 [Spiroplasma sp. NBRC 100390]
MDRYITECYNIHLDQKQIVKNLSIFIHGIELDLVAYEKCIINLNNLLIKRNINLKVNWDIVFGDSLKEEKYDNKMDYVVGNPPYIRIHDLESINYKKFAFANKGMTDLFIIFYEISLKMLNSNGKLIYITPNSYFTSTAGEKLRHFIYSNKKINTIVNLKHFNPFENVTTYTTITLLNNSLNNSIYYFEYDKNKKIPKKIAKLNYSDFYINKQFYFSTKNSLNKFRKIMLTEFNRDIHIKNGVSSNLDSFFLIKIIMVNILLMQ